MGHEHPMWLDGTSDRLGSRAVFRRRYQAFDFNLVCRRRGPLGPVEQVAPPLFLRVVGVFDLEPSNARVIRIVQPLGDNPLEVMFAHQLEEFAPPARDR